MMWLLLQMLKVNLLYNNEIWGPKHFLRIGSAVKNSNTQKIFQKFFTKNIFQYGFLQKMRPNPQFPADLVTFTEEILNAKFKFLCSCRHTKKYCFSFKAMFAMLSIAFALDTLI